MLRHLKYRVLAEPLAIYRFASDASVPRWAQQDGFSCVVRTSDELSIVCNESIGREAAGALAEDGWLALKLEGPFPFSLTGVLASFLRPLAEAQVPIFALSTFDTDYVLIKRDYLQRAVTALAAAGHERLE